MKNSDMPYWMSNLESEDLEFIKNFMVNSGSLKALAKYYDVSYPTLRQRLNNVITKIESVQDDKEDTLINHIKKLAIEEKLDLNDAKRLLDIYKKEKGD
ncbi:DUF2089 family protein [Staphylococcus arlettae]|uniref:DUF2089 family protein n=1 Tax=Staphylococcus arlettae TaxID=29378 RepID=UPI00113C1379|nr:DUF2089 family protein [Staphylococcus arlettae]MCD9055391.1 DUF2089 domain-containing protein [Staphylococcus arlettae]UXU50996.1 DUF2089 domain-containing protein [Staphylococcus arlettae]UXU53692.1 DUF2089 domain-containing protein [Staphylococcus arlettae]BBK28001.1 hypothetical protein SAP2_11850 [Staphylococcus arlettae]